MRYPTLLAFVVITATDASASGLSREIVADIEKMIDRESVRAVAVGLYDNGESNVMGFGRLSNDDARAPDGNTVFEIGSVSKVFTSLLAQVQVDAGNLDWEQSIASVLPQLEFANNAVASITVQELSTHTSGLPRIPDNMEFEDPMDPYKGYGRADLMAFISSFDPKKLTKEYAYSNLGAGLLGVLAADAADADFGVAMQREVLQPLGLGDTAVGLPQELRNRLAVGFSNGADMPNWDGFDALAGAGALTSTVDDMLRFIHHCLNDSGLDGSITAIQQRQAEGTTALGWHIEELDDGSIALWHNGGTGGYASFLGIRPDAGTGVVMLTTSTEYMPVTELGMAQMSGRPHDTETVDLAAYPGAYELAEGFVLTIFERDGRLHGQATGQAAFPLTPESEDTFSFKAADIELTFERDGSGAVNELRFSQAGNRTLAKRVSDDLGIRQYDVIEVAADTLQEYAGRYQLAPEVVISAEVRGEQLYVQVTGQPALPVFAYEPDRFFYKAVDAQLHFERNEDGIVDAVVLHQAGQHRAPIIRE